MNEKVKQVLDNKAAWGGLGMLVGAIFGDKAATFVGFLASMVMSVI